MRNSGTAGEGRRRMAPNFRKIIAEQAEKIELLNKLLKTHEEMEKALNEKISIRDQQISEQDALIQELRETCRKQQELLDQCADILCPADSGLDDENPAENEKLPEQVDE